MPETTLSTSDGELIQQLQNADLEALGLLFERHRARVYHTALAIVRDPEAAEDILQDCFLKVYVNAKRIDPNRPLAPWLYRVTVNLSYTWLSRRNGRRTAAVARSAGGADGNAPESAPRDWRPQPRSARGGRAVLSEWAGLAGYRRDTGPPRWYGEIAPVLCARESTQQAGRKHELAFRGSAWVSLVL